MRKVALKDRANIQLYINQHSDNEKKYLYKKIDEMSLLNFTESKIISRIRVYSGIIKISEETNDNTWDNLYERYWSTNSQTIKLSLIKTKEELELWKNKLKSRPKPTNISCWSTQYWIDEGFTIDQSISKVKTIQSTNAKKRTRESYSNFSKKIKYSLDYWVNKGYTIEESEILREPHLLPMLNDLNSMKSRYGETEGTKRHKKKIAKYTATMQELLSSRRTGGYVSKESLKFFIPLYKKIRKLGIPRSDIYFGINGSREFFIRRPNIKENSGMFYDFTIPKLNIIIEYNGTFWHPREKHNWSNSFVDFDYAKAKDVDRNNLALSRNMDMFIVWSDDDKESVAEKLFNIIQERI